MTSGTGRTSGAGTTSDPDSVSRPTERERPRDRQLDRAPGDRYTGGIRATEAEATTQVEPRLGFALLYGALTAFGIAVAWALAVGLLDITRELLIVAVIGGWAIGAAAAFGAWRGVDHRSDLRVRGIAVMCGMLAWLVGTFGAYVIALAVLPASDLSLGERIAGTPFGDALVNQFSLIDMASIALLALVAWRSSR